MVGTQPPTNHPAKVALRDQLLTARRRRPLLEVGEAARAIAEHLLAAPELRVAPTVAAYVSIGTEPGSSWLLDGLLARGRRLLLPVLRPDNDLDWAVHTGESELASAGRGLLEPTGARLGVDAVAGADVVVVPGLAVSPTGLRMGRGGGSYDRVLARVAAVSPTTFTCVVLYDDEADRAVPAEPHDRPVAAVVTPSGITRF